MVWPVRVQFLDGCRVVKRQHQTAWISGNLTLVPHSNQKHLPLVLCKLRAGSLKLGSKMTVNLSDRGRWWG